MCGKYPQSTILVFASRRAPYAYTPDTAVVEHVEYKRSSSRAMRFKPLLLKPYTQQDFFFSVHATHGEKTKQERKR
jgi:hypothetical protein